MALAPPPFRNRMESLELPSAGAPDDTKNVQVRMLGQEFAGHGRTVENDGPQVTGRRVLQAFYKFAQFCFHTSECPKLRKLTRR